MFSKMSLRILTSLFFILVVTAPILFMIQALFVWQKSSQLLVQRRYAEMQRSVLASLDQMYNDFYKPSVHKLSRNLSNKITIENNSLSSKKINDWLNLSQNGSTDERETALISKIVLDRVTQTFPQKLQALCDSFKLRYVAGFKQSQLLKLREIPLSRLQNCSSSKLSKLIDEFKLNDAMSRLTKRNHIYQIYAPDKLQISDKLHRMHPWNIFSQFMIHNSCFLWMGGSNELGNSIFKPSARINILGGYKDLNWNPDFSLSALDYELVWSHDSNSVMQNYVNGEAKEPKVFNYVLFRKKLLESNFIEQISQILMYKKPPSDIHPEYKVLFDELTVKIDKLFKRKKHYDSISAKHLISISREQWRNSHLDRVLSSSKLSLNSELFTNSDYVKEKNLIGHRISFGVPASLLLTESNFAYRLIWITILFSLLILFSVISISFKILPQPILNLIDNIKAIKIDSLLFQRLNYPLNLPGDEIKTLENSFHLMKSELSLRFRELDFIRMINYQILNKQPLEGTLKLLINYIANCLPNTPYGLAIYYYQSARQSFPTHCVEFGKPIDLSNINQLETEQEGSIVSSAGNFIWYKRNLNKISDSNSSYILMTLDKTSFGQQTNSSIKSFISTVLDQLEALLYQNVLQQIQKDNEIASQLQQGILAPINIENDHIQIAADMRSAGYLGGDFFTIIERNNEILFGIADVTSKGIAPALVGNCARSLIHYFSDDCCNKILNKVNKSLIAEGFSDQHFVTCFMGTINEKLTFNYVAAGHQMMIHINRVGKLSYLNGPNIPLGLDAEQVFEIQSMNLQTGELVFLYTDGIPELQNHEQELFTQERLEELILSCKDESAKEIEKIIYHEIRNFVGNKGLSDDVTTVIIKV